MDLETAVSAHVAWKTKLRRAIANKEELDIATITRDDCCELGKWLHGDGRREFSSLTSDAMEHFKDCTSKHALFHKEAGKVAKLINDKKYTEAEAVLGAGSAYANASSDVGVAIQRLKKDIGQ